MSLNDNLGVCAISPKDIDDLKKKYLLEKAHKIPKEIVKIFNDLIVENFRGSQAEVLQATAIERIVAVMKIPRTDVFEFGWLDVELLFEEAGWHVTYDKPAYNENYEPKWVFKKRP